MSDLVNAGQPVLKIVDVAERLVIGGPRVTLRPPSFDDAGDVAAALSDYGVAKNLSQVPYPYAFQDAIEWLRTQTDPENRRFSYSFAIVTDGALIGVVSLTARPGRVELGYWLARSRWGHGFATEAARLALEFAFDKLELDRIEAGYFADNAASGRVLAKLGFAYIRDVARFSRARDRDVPCRTMTLDRNEFAGRIRKTGEGETGHGG